MAENRNVPKVRFQGYNKAWKTSKAEDIFYAIADKNHSGLPVLSASQELGMIRRDETGKSIYYDKKSETTYKRVQPGQFVIHLRSFQGGFAHSTVEGITSPAYTVLDFLQKDDHYDFFWKYIFASEPFIKRLETVTYGIRDGRSISYGDFLTMAYSHPDAAEQTAIGNFFRNLDRLITLHQHKYEKLIAIKGSLLDKLLPRDGQVEPEIRFAGYTGKWAQHKILDIVEQTYGGGTPATSNEDFWAGGIPWLQSSDLTEHNVQDVCPQKHISDVGVKSSATKIVPANSIAVVTRVGVGKLALIPFSFATSQDFLSLSGIKVNEWFAVYSLYKKLQSELHMVQGTSIKGITKDELLAKKIAIPPQVAEQTAIGNYFRSLDNLIAAQSKKLEKLRTLKKSMLEKLFV